MWRIAAAGTIVALLLMQAASAAFAADAWPSKPIRVVVPFSPGGSTDITARVLADGPIFAPLIEVLPHIRSGAIKPLGVCGKKRSPLIPNVPMISDLLPGYEMTSWTGILAPARTPPDIVNRMQEAIVKVLNQPNVKTHFAEADKERVGSTPAEFKQFIAVEVERLRMQVKISGARID